MGKQLYRLLFNSSLLFAFNLNLFFIVIMKNRKKKNNRKQFIIYSGDIYLNICTRNRMTMLCSFCCCNSNTFARIPMQQHHWTVFALHFWLQIRDGKVWTFYPFSFNTGTMCACENISLGVCVCACVRWSALGLAQVFQIFSFNFSCAEIAIIRMLTGR